MTAAGYVERAGVRIRYEETGAGEPAVVLVHGSGCDLTTMAALAAHLRARHRVVSLDLRGHGRSDRPPGPYRGADFVGDVLAVAERARLDRPVLIGHSMGAKVVLEVSRVRPDPVRGLVLLDTAVVESDAYRAARRAELADATTAHLRRARRERMFLATSADRERLIAMMLGTPREVARSILAASDELDPAAALRACRAPVLYIGASAPRETAATLQALKPDLVYGQVVGSGHFVQVDVPEQVNPMIDRFLKLSASI